MPKAATKKAPKMAAAKKVEPTATHRTFTGTVLKNAANKTVTVVVHRMKLNEKYQKKYRVSKKYHVHDEKNEAKAGQTVQFQECRPLSKTKRWRLI